MPGVLELASVKESCAVELWAEARWAHVKASEALQSATDIIGIRHRNYGDPKVMQGRIAARLTSLFSFPIEDYEAALAMVEVKLARIAESPDVLDHYVDGLAYLALACELKTEEGLYV